jgi:hypothetical protein
MMRKKQYIYQLPSSVERDGVEKEDILTTIQQLICVSTVGSLKKRQPITQKTHAKPHILSEKPCNYPIWVLG